MRQKALGNSKDFTSFLPFLYCLLPNGYCLGVKNV